MTTVLLGDLFVACRDPASVLAVRDGMVLRLGQFGADVMHAATLTRAARVTRGAVLAADPYRFLVGLFGLLHAGAVAVVPPDALPTTLERLHGWFDAVVCDQPLPGAVPTLPIREGLGCAGSLGGLDPAATTLEFFTSGSTGAAKRVARPLALLDREIAVLEALWGAAAGRGPALAMVPHRHVFGLTFHLLWPLASGRPFVSAIDHAWESVLARDVSDAVLVTSPAHLTRLRGIAPLPPGRRPALVLTAGAPLHAAQAQEAADVLGVPPTEIFGSTETGAIATRMQLAADAAWTPLPGIRVDSDAAGCMVVHSPFAPGGGSFASADRVELTTDGRFHFLGRADRIAKIEGVRVSLARLEDELAALPWVEEAAALVLAGTPARLAAVVVPHPSGRTQLAALGRFRFSRELRRQLSAVLEPAWLPKSWRFVERLPHGALGKPHDAGIRALFAPARRGAPSP